MIQQAYVEGVSTRRVDDLVKALGCEGISKSQVSRICQELDVVVDGFMGRPLGGGPYPYLWLDGLTQKVREDGRIVNVSVVVATAVTGEGKREIICYQVILVSLHWTINYGTRGGRSTLHQYLNGRRSLCLVTRQES